MLAHSAVVVTETDGGARNLTRPRFVAKLRENLRRLCNAGRAERMTAADEATPGIDDHVATVLAAPGCDEGARLALLAEPQLLVRDQLGDGEAVVDLGDVDVTGRDAGHPVRRRRRPVQRRPVSVVLVERGELEAVERLAGSANPHWLLGDRARPFLAGQDHRRGAVGDRRAHK